MTDGWKKTWAIAKQAVKDFISDDAMSLGGALAFYTALSLAPLLVLVLAIAGFLWQEGDVRGELLRQVGNLVGPGGAEAVKTILEDVGREKAHGVAAVIGVVTLLFGATSVFAQLQYSLNRVWNVEAKPGEDVADFLRKRLLSLGMILAIAFLLIVSLVVSAGLSFLAGPARTHLPGGDFSWRALNFGASLVVYTGIFTLIHHSLPDVKISWRDGLVGGVMTAVLFAIGKELLGYYLGQRSTTSAYGAAGSFFVVLLWVYYSSLILFIGAELTQAFVTQMGHPLAPDEHARLIRTTKEAVT
ncbi:MAG: YihY/virulence factor BrkB family protein [Polyangiaceae bacterium]